MSVRDRVCLQVSTRCNMRCRFCNVWTRDEELELELVKRLVDELQTLDVHNFDLTGGETLLYRELVELIRYIKAAGGWCSVTTNGLLLTESLAQRLADTGLDHLQMSLDGINGTHDRLRGHKGAFAAVPAALPYLSGFPGNKNIAVAVSEDNVEELPAIEALADEYQVGIWFTPVALYSKDIADAIRPPSAEAVERIRPRMSRPRSQEKLGWVADALRPGHDGYCKVPDIRYTIRADATLAPCAFLRGCGDLRKESIESILQSDAFRAACGRAGARSEEPCQGCYIWSTR